MNALSNCTPATASTIVAAFRIDGVRPETGRSGLIVVQAG